MKLAYATETQNAMTLQENLIKHNLQLPQTSKPGGNYVSVNVRGKIAYVAIQFPILNDEFLYQGRIGEDLTTEEATKAMELCGLNVLAQIDKNIGIEKIEGLNHLEMYFQHGKDWDDSPLVANGASDLFVNILGDKGLHSRSIIGVEKLARNFSVGLTASFTLL